MNLKPRVQRLWETARPSMQSLWSNLRGPLKWGLGVAVLTALLSLALANEYTSEVHILPKDPKRGGSGLSSLAAAASALGVNLGSPGDDPSASYPDILKSRWVSDALLTKKYSYKEATWFFGKAKPREGTLLQYLDVKNVDLGAQALTKVMDVQRDPKSNLLTVDFTTRSPQLSQQLAQESNRLLERFIQDNGKTQSGARAEYAKNRLEEAKQEALKSEEEFRKFLEINRNYASSSEPRVRLMGGRLEADLNLRRQVVTNLALAYEQALLDQADDTPIVTILDPGNLPIEKSKPSRGLLTLAMFLLAGLVAWAMEHKTFVKSLLKHEEAA